MNNLPFKKFKKQLNERRYSGPERGDKNIKNYLLQDEGCYR